MMVTMMRDEKDEWAGTDGGESSERRGVDGFADGKARNGCRQRAHVPEERLV